MKRKLYDETIELMRQRIVPTVEVCRTVGVTVRWYDKVMRKEISDPGVKRVQAVHDFLSREKRRQAKW